MRKIILTIDYELFLGEKTGSVRECMIEPTKRLAYILDKNHSKMTVFWDILHYYRLLQLEKRFLELKQDRLLIEEQISNLVIRGHDIQLHLHPHWLDASYNDGKWNFKYDRFKLHSLSNENKIDDINSIVGCVSISKKIMENLVRKVNPEYKVQAFRAGGYLVEPFDKIKDALFLNEIKIDSSVCPGSVNSNTFYSFDFRSYPNIFKYNFESTPKNVVASGGFTEIPITTIKIPAIINFFFKLFKKYKYVNIENERKGTGTGEYSYSNVRTFSSKLISLTQAKFAQLTTDSNFRERFHYLFKRVTDYSTMIIHPKLLNTHTLGILDDYISTNKIRFLSIKDFLS